MSPSLSLLLPPAAAAAEDFFPDDLPLAPKEKRRAANADRLLFFFLGAVGVAVGVADGASAAATTGAPLPTAPSLRSADDVEVDEALPLRAPRGVGPSAVVAAVPPAAPAAEDGSPLPP